MIGRRVRPLESRTYHLPTRVTRNQTTFFSYDSPRQSVKVVLGCCPTVACVGLDRVILCCVVFVVSDFVQVRLCLLWWVRRSYAYEMNELD